MSKLFIENLVELSQCLSNLSPNYLKPPKDCITATVSAVKNGNTLFFCGNGGSSSTASHICNDLSCHMKNWDRDSYACVCLNDSPAVLTSLTNDYGFEHVFAKPLSALAKPGDVIWGFSTSGNSQNVVKAFEVARQKQMISVAFTGRSGGKLKNMCDIWIPVNSDEVIRVEELHLIYAHAIAVSIEAKVSPSKMSLA